MNYESQLPSSEAPNSPAINHESNSHRLKKLRMCLSALSLIAAGLVVETFGASTASAGDGDYPWDNATTLNAPSYQYGYESCPKSDPECKSYPLMVYTYDGQQYGESDPWGYYLKTCTSYVAWKESSEGASDGQLTGLGNANTWYSRAPASEQSIIPKAGEAAVDPTIGDDGHVAYIESVNSINSTDPLEDNITISEYNYTYMDPSSYDTRTGTARDLGFTEFVDFGVTPTGDSATPPTGHLVDFNGDGREDVSVRNDTRYMADIGHNGGNAEVNFTFGRETDQSYVGDFNGDGKADVVLHRGTTFYFDYNDDGVADLTYSMGKPGDKVLIGDFNGDGRDDIVLWRGNTFYVDSAHNGDTAEIKFPFGVQTDEAYVGDFNGDGRDDIMLRRGTQLIFEYDNKGTVSLSCPFGRIGDQVLIGDFNGDGRDDVALKRGQQYFIDTSHNCVADISFGYGKSTDLALVGDINGDGKDEIILKRDEEYLADTAHNGDTAEEKFGFGPIGSQSLVKN